jgi:hypothetical protein
MDDIAMLQDVAGKHQVAIFGPWRKVKKKATDADGAGRFC